MIHPKKHSTIKTYINPNILNFTASFGSIIEAIQALMPLSQREASCTHQA